PGGPEERAYMAEHYESNWFFDAHVWRKDSLERYELTEIFRQKDENFKHILNAIRVGQVSQEMLDELNQAGNRWPPHADVIRLATVNESVNRVNTDRLSQIDNPVKQFHAIFGEGDQKAFGANLPAEPVINLKVGAQVMFIKNDDGNKRSKDGTALKRWVNGTVGHVVELPSSGGVIVEVDGERLEVGLSTWEKVRYEVEEDFDEATGKVREILVAVPVAEFRQIPLRLAWSVTVHKSQGQTYDEVQIDMGRGAFSPGQTYVALSRVRSMEGLYLTRAIRMNDIMVDQNVLRFMSGVRTAPADQLFD
ncbi:MAG: helicase, partial [Micrococcales bacterium]